MSQSGRAIVIELTRKNEPNPILVTQGRVLEILQIGRDELLMLSALLDSLTLWLGWVFLSIEFLLIF